MLILITAEEEPKNEVEILQQISQFNSTLIHVRKPNFSVEKMKAWLQQFSKAVLKKMVLHQHQQLIEEFEIGGIHLKESDKTHFPSTEIEKLQKSGVTVSASFHQLKEAETQTQFDYVLLSPVFDSVSKNNHQGQKFHVGNNQKPIIALGGIGVKNLHLTQEMGYHGVAVLGNVWQDESPLQSFKIIERVYQNIYG